MWVLRPEPEDLLELPFPVRHKRKLQFYSLETNH
jgi:hypothetical protein